MVRPARGSPPHSAWSLTAIKTAHTIVWAFFVGCILAVWLFAWRAEFLKAALSGAIVLGEVLVLAFNKWRCPRRTKCRR